MLYGEILRQRLKITKEHVVADTIDYLEAKFTFSGDWNGLEKWVHFSHRKTDAVYDIRLTDDCIRKEDHLNLSAGLWRVYLHGSEYVGGEVVERITTDIADLEVRPTGMLNGEPFPEMPESVTEQILARLAKLEAGGGTADSVNWSGVIGRPEASVNIDTDKADQTKYATPYAVHQYVGTKMASALIYKGSVTFSNLPALAAENVGHVYNVTDAFTTTANFVEGSGHIYAAGQNVAVAEVSDGVYRYDVLAQPIDLSGYVQQDELHEITNEEFDALWDSVFTEG